MRINKIFVLTALTASLASTLAIGQENTPPNTQLNALIEAQRYEDAYILATSDLEAWEGDTDFDFLYGIAAIESGYANESVYAFERVANTAPRNVTRQRARLELARAYLSTNNLAGSETLFNEVLASNPPENVQDNIRAFLSLIEERRSTRKSTFSFAFAPVIGHDDNINSATSNGLIDTPLISEIELNSDGLKTADEFMDITVNVAYKKPLSRDRSVDLTLIANRHDNQSSDQFDIGYALADLTYGYGNDTHRFRHSIQAQTLANPGVRSQSMKRLTLALRASAAPSPARLLVAS
jgi:tetratricopeptide (TPR) repeat protein